MRFFFYSIKQRGLYVRDVYFITNIKMYKHSLKIRFMDNICTKITHELIQKDLCDKENGKKLLIFTALSVYYF